MIVAKSDCSWIWWIAGEPKGQPRPRFDSANRRAYHKSHAVDHWKAAISAAVVAERPREPLAGPLEISWMAYMPRPQRFSRKKDPDGPMLHLAKPDRDNMDKAVMDVLKSMGWVSDDAMVCHGTLLKGIVEKGGETGMLVKLRQLDADDVLGLQQALEEGMSA